MDNIVDTFVDVNLFKRLDCSVSAGTVAQRGDTFPKAARSMNPRWKNLILCGINGNTETRNPLFIVMG
jgi:hypothetical protein